VADIENQLKERGEHHESQQPELEHQNTRPSRPRLAKPFALQREPNADGSDDQRPGIGPGGP